ncbi:FecCD family ABC transporter permease [Arthrobacter woluwensis]|uniref:Iron complex transport system permease protein n=1 Tax=Arthrobacter woluwensis TaxID=156980 RepID=A0A1H4PA52_9MICC|nr:iron chelate uptake ABC transporter family permease subunit [Arthrobacter woluwensis]SEC03872.1 iron complex transport system permease protein [Arthrobacter woluwensis]
MTAAGHGSRVMVLRAGPYSRRITLRTVLVMGVLAALIPVSLVLALTLGPGGVPLGSVFYALTPDAATADRLVFEWRAARALGAVLFGVSLGISGAIFQTLTRNPLGSPDIIGLNAGAYTGVVGVILLGGSGFAATAAGALGGGLLAAACVYLLAFRQGIHGFRLIIVGIAVGAILSALTSWFSVKADLDVALRAAIWGAGSLFGLTWEPLGAAAAAALLLLAALVPAARMLPQFALGDEAAASLGLRVERAKALLVLLGVGFTALVTAVAGPISFIALAAPQIARRLVGGGDGAGLAASGLVGGVLLAGADLAAQYLLPGIKLPVGAITVVIGGGYLLWLLFRESGRS